MRWTLLLFAMMLPGLLFACGGGDETTEEATKPEEDTPKEPPKPTLRDLSPEAKEVLKAYHEVNAIRERKEKIAEATRRAEEFADAALPADAQVFVGLLWGFAEETEKAAGAYQEFVDGCDNLTKNYETGITKLIQAYCDIGQTDKAAMTVDMYVDAFPAKVGKHGMVQYNIARTKLAEGDFESAYELCEKAVQNDYGTAAQLAIECLWAMGKYDEARTKADEYVETFRSSPTEQRSQEMAMLCKKLGEKAPSLVFEGWGENEQFSLSDAQGEVTLVYFWNMSMRWAEKVEKALKKRLFDRYAEKGFNIVGVSKHLKYDLMTGRKNEAFQTKEEIEQLGNWKYNFKTPWAIGLAPDNRNHEAYGFRALPSYAIVGKDGKYRFFFCDASKDAIEVLANVIEKLMAE